MKQQKVSVWRICWELLVPILVYTGVAIIVSLIGGAVIGANAYLDLQGVDLLDEYAVTEKILEITLPFAVLLQTIAAIIAVPLLYLMYKKDWKRRIYRVDHRSVAYYKKIYAFIAGAAACLAANLILSFPWIYRFLGQGYDAVSESLFSGSVIVQWIGIGIIIPICEEFVFRGLIYMRLRDRVSVKPAIVISAVIFGVYHGNLLQGIYAFLLGILMAYMMEKYKSITAPCLFHVAANLLSMGLNMLSLNNSWIISGLIIVSLCVLTVAVYLIFKNVDPKVEIIKPGAEDFPDEVNSHSGSGPEGGNSRYSVDDYYPKARNVDDYYPKAHDVDDYYPGPHSDEEER